VFQNKKAGALLAIGKSTMICTTPLCGLSEAILDHIWYIFNFYEFEYSTLEVSTSTNLSMQIYCLQIAAGSTEYKLQNKMCDSQYSVYENATSQNKANRQ
jgi:hypothetical protein